MSSCCHRFKSTSHQRGAALIVALLIFAVSAALMVGLQRDFTLLFQRSNSSSIREQSWQYLLAAEALASVALSVDAKQDANSPEPIDHMGEVWASASAPYPLENGGMMAGSVTDLQGRLNINALGFETSTEGEERFGTTQKQFIRLVQSLGDASVSQRDAMILADSIADFIDADNETRIDGAESLEYRNAIPPYLAANRPLQSTTELRAIKGMTTQLYNALVPFITVWPIDGTKLNILTATVPVLRTLNDGPSLDPLGQVEAEQLLQKIQAGEVTTVSGLLEQPELEGKDLSALESTLDTKSSWFLLDARVEFADREVQMYSVLQREEFKVTPRFRSQGTL